MLDIVLERRRGLPIALSVVDVEVARRAGIDLQGVGLPGHYVVGHFGQAPPLLVDPFGSYLRRADLTRAIHAAELRLELPLGESEDTEFTAELRSLRARLN